MGPARHRIEIWHQTIAQLVVPNDSLVARMILRCDVPHLTQRPLTMGAVQGNKAPELIPTCLQLTPFLEITVLYSRLIILLLCCHITVLHTEATLIHAPERDSAHRIVQSGSHLCPHILPTGTDITTPCGGRVTLFASKTATSKQEDTRFVVGSLKDRSLAIVDGIGINCGICVEILSRCTEGRRTAKRLAVPHRGTVAHIRLRSIHPPGINAMLELGIELLIHLSPEHLASTGIVGIIEPTYVSRTNPVVNIIFHCLRVHPSFRIKLLVVIRIHVELRPYGDHETTVHLMNVIKHCLGSREARSLELMTTPLVFWPIVPVLHDIINRNLTVAELLQCSHNLILCLVTLPALPEAEHPFRIDGCLTCQGTIARDDLIEVVSGNEIVVHIAGHLTPDAQLTAFFL